MMKINKNCIVDIVTRKWYNDKNMELKTNRAPYQEEPLPLQILDKKEDSKNYILFMRLVVYIS